MGADQSPFGIVRPAGKIPIDKVRYEPLDNPLEPRYPSDLTQIPISRGSKVEVATEFEEGAKLFKWFFKCDSGDVFFSMYRVLNASPDQKTTVYPRLRLNTEYVPEWGQMELENDGKAGKIIMEFDNSHSVLKSKTVKYYSLVE